MSDVDLQEKLIRARVRQILREEAKLSDLLTPFVDVGKTVVGKTKETLRAARGLVRIGLEFVGASVLPFVKGEYAEILDKQNKDIDKIKSKYQDVYDRTDKALKGDAAILAFLAFPGPIIAKKASSKVPEVAGELLSAITGIEIRTADSKTTDSSKLKSKKSPSDIFDSFMRTNSSILREEKESSEEKKENSLATKLADKKVINAALQKSSRAQELSDQARAIHNETFNSIFQQATKLLKATSLDEFAKITGKPLPEEISKMSPEEKKKSEGELLKQMKDEIKKVYVDNLKNEGESLLKAGIPAEHPFIKDYQTIIEKIKAL